MARLIHLNGPPGIGKSTVARRYVEQRPGVLNCDVDVLRSLVGGWRSDFIGTGRLVRPAALALIEAYLHESGDVVLPQMLLPLQELELFEAAAYRAGAAFVTIMLLDDRDRVVRRFRRRGYADPDPWHDQVRAIVDDEGGDSRLLECYDALMRLRERRSDTMVVRSTEADVDGTCRAVAAVLGS
ncbi:MAG: AAA family ATPase [Marmoricola sp.]